MSRSSSHLTLQPSTNEYPHLPPSHDINALIIHLDLIAQKWINSSYIPVTFISAVASEAEVSLSKGVIRGYHDGEYLHAIPLSCQCKIRLTEIDVWFTLLIPKSMSCGRSFGSIRNSDLPVPPLAITLPITYALDTELRRGVI